MGKFSDVKVYLYDVSGDAELDFEKIDLESLNDKQLLWVNLFKRDADLLTEIAEKLNIQEIRGSFLERIIRASERPKLDKFENLYRFFIVSVETDKNRKIRKRAVDFLVGKNFVVTVSDGEPEYFKEFRMREQGETNIGELDTESFIGTLLDFHIVTYFRALEYIEAEVDDLDDKILSGETKYKEFLKKMVRLRSDVSNLRRWFLPHRDVFYALSRPDFFPAMDSDALEYFKTLSAHFEHGVDIIEGSRDTVISLFDLYAAKTNEKTNRIIQRLTFVTLVVGTLGVFAGAMGMNFNKFGFFEHEYGFWIMTAIMLAFAGFLALLAFWRKWI
jgi:magnesium transporter